MIVLINLREGEEVQRFFSELDKLAEITQVMAETVCLKTP
jgi:hypothetical protein